MSDFDLPTPPPTPAKIKAIFDRYLAVLDRTGLRALFEPVERRVTLGAHAGVGNRTGGSSRRPWRACARRPRSRSACSSPRTSTTSGPRAPTLHMSALQFRSPGSATFDFDDWLQAPAMVAHLMGALGGPNAEAALRQHLRHSHGFDVQAVEGAGRGPTTTVRGTLWKAVGPAAGAELADVHAPFPVEGQVTLGPRGQIRSVRLAEPPAPDVLEAAAFVRSLARHGQLGGSGGRADAATHDLETDARGRRKLVRKRFRAI